MKLIDFLVDKFGKEQTEYIISQKIETKKYSLAVEDFAIQLAINIIAGIISKCEFKIVENGEETKGDEYYLWNYQPNFNQNGTDFIFELISKLIYRNEVLIVENGGQLIIADDFERKQYVLYQNTYSNVRREDYTFPKVFLEQDVIYLRYTYSKIRGLLSSMMAGYSELIGLSMQKYKRAGGRKGVMKTKITPQQNEEWNKALNDLYTNRFKSYFQNENALVVLPDGMDYSEIQASGNQKSTSDVADIVNLTKEAFTRAAQAARIAPALLIGDVSNLDSALEETITIGILPLVDLLEGEILRKRFGLSGFKKGYRIIIDTTNIKHFDLLEIADKADKLIAAGLYNIDEIREKLGDSPLNTWWSSKHFMTKNYAELNTECLREDKAEGGGKDV